MPYIFGLILGRMMPAYYRLVNHTKDIDELVHATHIA